jgi:acyl-CoA thioester hydrolase
MDYCVFSHRHEKVAAEGEGLIVTFDYRNQKKAPIPEVLRNRISEYEKVLSSQVSSN